MRGSPSQAANPAALPLSDQIYWHDRDKRWLAVRAETHRLTNKEAAVMDCLLEDPGALRSLDYISYHIWAAWGHEEPDWSDVEIRLFIMRIRRKIGHFIHNVWGSGYYLGAPEDAGRAPEPLEDSPGALPSSPTCPTM